MRFIRMGAFLAWGAFASLAVVGFAAFNPATDAIAPPASIEIPSEVAVDPLTGSLAGRVAAVSFATTTAPETRRPPGDNVDLLGATARADASTESIPEAPTTTVATTPEPPTTTAPEPTTTTVAQAPPETTTTIAVETTTTTVAETGLVIPPGTEPWVSLVEAYFAPGDVQRALDVIWCESRGNPDATNASSGAAGLFQHLPKYGEERSANAGWAGASIYEPTANTAVAAWLVYSDGGWKHWNPSAYCWG